MTWTYDLHTWSEPVTILTESCHLSYPFVFKDDGKVYMIPETGALKSIRLYQALDDSLTKWEYVCNLVEENGNLKNVDLSFCDSSIIIRNGIYYLFTTIVRNHINELHLYYARDLKGPFEAHPLSPILRSNKYGRNAGSIILYGNCLWRVTQECSNTYGENVNIAKIIEISPEKYAEVFYKDSFFDREESFYCDGAHQLNVVRFKNKFIVATDAKGYRKVLFQRLVSKFVTPKINDREDF